MPFSPNHGEIQGLDEKLRLVSILGVIWIIFMRFDAIQQDLN